MFSEILYIHCPIFEMTFSSFHKLQVRVKIKVVTGTPSGAVAAEARWSGFHWVILDK